MSLSPQDRVRFARHTLLPEIGLDGQARLCSTVVRLPTDADGAATEVARDYLDRAGVTITAAHAAEVRLPTASTVGAWAPAHLRHAAAALAGAYAAVETIKVVTRAGAPGPTITDFQLYPEVSE